MRGVWSVMWVLMGWVSSEKGYVRCEMAGAGNIISIFDKIYILTSNRVLI